MGKKGEGANTAENPLPDFRPAGCFRARARLVWARAPAAFLQQLGLDH